MSSTSALPFHLRPNKYVERRLFIECLVAVDKAFDLGTGAYISMGGRALEDHRLVHRRFRTRALLSIEDSTPAVERQIFNRPFPFIECQEMASSQLVADFDTVASSLGSGGPFVVWLDYTNTDRQVQLQETEALVTKLASGDVAKVTLNASMHTLREAVAHGGHEPSPDSLAEELEQQLGAYAGGERVQPEDMNRRGLVRQLALAVKNAALRGVNGSSDLGVYLLAAFQYTDFKHHMLTVTFAVVNDHDWSELERSGATNWEFFPNRWEDVTLIDVPDLSVKEQLHISKLIGSSIDDTVVSALEFRLGTDADTKRHLTEYDRHHLRYPAFVPVIF